LIEDRLYRRRGIALKYFRLFARNTIEMTFIAVLFLLSNIANADIADTLQRGEEAVVLDVQNMT